VSGKFTFEPSYTQDMPYWYDELKKMEFPKSAGEAEWRVLDACILPCTIYKYALYNLRYNTQLSEKQRDILLQIIRYLIIMQECVWTRSRIPGESNQLIEDLKYRWKHAHGMVISLLSMLPFVKGKDNE